MTETGVTWNAPPQRRDPIAEVADELLSAGQFEQAAKLYRALYDKAVAEPPFVATPIFPIYPTPSWAAKPFTTSLISDGS